MHFGLEDEDAPGVAFGPDATTIALRRMGPSAARRRGAVCVLEDLDGDGCQDLAITAPGHAWIAGVRCYSGRIGRVLWSVQGAWRFGSDAVRLPDVDGDGRDELLVSQWNRGWEGPDFRRVHVVRSSEREVLLTIEDRSARVPKDRGEKQRPCRRRARRP